MTPLPALSPSFRAMASGHLSLDEAEFAALLLSPSEAVGSTGCLRALYKILSVLSLSRERARLNLGSVRDPGALHPRGIIAGIPRATRPLLRVR